MKNKYDNLVEEINKQEEIAEQKDNLAEQLAQTTTNVNTIKDAASDLLKAADAVKDAARICNAAALSTDNSATAITDAILDARKVEIKHRLDDETVKQLDGRYANFLKKEQGLLDNHKRDLQQMLDQNKDRCYEIINKGDGVYLGRKTFMRLCIVFCICFGVILLEVVYVLLKWLGW